MALTVMSSLLGSCTRQPTSKLTNYLPMLVSSINGLKLSQSQGFEQRRSYAMRLELTEHGIIWKRPQYVPSWKPSKSGDLGALPKADLSRPTLKIMAAKEAFDQADEVTKKLLSLEFNPHKESLKIMRKDSLKRIQRHKYDVGSLEATIAMLTLRIRNYQQIVAQDKKDTLIKVRLDETIARRKKLLKHLRRMDYKCFEWLIEELGLLYKPYPVAYHWITRKDSLRKLVQMHKDTIKEDRLEAYKQVLEAQKEPFLKEKAETLEWIAKTEKELGVPVTVEVDSVATK